MNSIETQDLVVSWVKLYSADLHLWAKRKTRDREAAEDLVQETFIAALKGAEKFEGRSNPRTWLFGILNNKINDHFRKSSAGNSRSKDSESIGIIHSMFDESGHWRKSEVIGNWDENESQLLDNDEFNAVLEACLNKLPSQWGASIQLKYLDERNGEEICQELGISPTNFWQIIHRAKLQLRKCLESNWFGGLAK